MRFRWIVYGIDGMGQVGTLVMSFEFVWKILVMKFSET